MEQRIKGTTGLLALIGSPVGHSGSPAMYNFSFQYHNLDYAYMAFDIKEDQVPAALDAMRLFKMRGCNVTMPCKNKVAQCVDELSPAAKIIGAVNTIVNEDGKLVGHITDGIGFVRNLKEHGVDVKGKKMVVLGAGGAATALTVQCALDGAASIAIFNPNDPFLDRAKGTAEKLAKEVPDCKVSVYCLDDQDKLREEIANADILANGTLAGMKPHDDITLVDKSMFHKDLVVADCVYNPAETRMVKEAKEAGVKRVVAHIPEGVEVSVRRNQDTDYVFVQNFNRQPVEVKLPVEQYPVWLGKYDGTIDRFGTVVLKGKAGEKE